MKEKSILLMFPEVMHHPLYLVRMKLQEGGPSALSSCGVRGKGHKQTLIQAGQKYLLWKKEKKKLKVYESHNRKCPKKYSSVLFLVLLISS